MSLILKEIKKKIGIIQFNNYEKRNSFSRIMMDEIISAFEFFREEKVRAVIIRAENGVKVWSSGHDINELTEPGKDPHSFNDPFEKMLRTIEQFPAPVIAMIEGTVWGGACELTFTCDILIATPDATFAVTPAKIGFPYNTNGILHFINMLGMSTIKEMFFTAKPLNAKKAEKLGLLNHIVPNEKIEEFTFNFAKEIIQNSPLAIAVIKEQLNILGNAHSMTPGSIERIAQLRKTIFESEDYTEGIKSFLERRKPNFKGNV